MPKLDQMFTSYELPALWPLFEPIIPQKMCMPRISVTPACYVPYSSYSANKPPFSEPKLDNRSWLWLLIN